MTVQNPSLPGSGIAVRVLRDDGKTYIGAVVPVELYTAGFAANAIRNSAGISATEIARLGMIQTTKAYTPARPPIIEGPGWAVFHGSMVTAAIARDDGVSYFSYTVDPGNYNASSVSSVLAAIPGLTASELARAKGIGGGVISGGTLTPVNAATFAEASRNERLVLTPSNMTSGNGLYYFHVVDVRDHPLWAGKVDWLGYASTDHAADGSAGIWQYFFVGDDFETAVPYTIEQATSMGLLSRLTTPPTTNPVFGDAGNAAGMTQIETPAVIRLPDNTFTMSYQIDNITGYRYTQATFRATSTDGVNWILPTARTVNDALFTNFLSETLGDGHTGYPIPFDATLYPQLVNPTTGQPWKYGAVSLGGGTDFSSRVFWGFDDPKALTRAGSGAKQLRSLHRYGGLLADQAALTGQATDWVFDNRTVQKLSDGSYSAIMNMATTASGATDRTSTMVEIRFTMDSEGYIQPISKPKVILAKGATNGPRGDGAGSSCAFIDRKNNKWHALYIYRDTSSGNKNAVGRISGPLRSPNLTIFDPLPVSITKRVVDKVDLRNLGGTADILPAKLKPAKFGTTNLAQVGRDPSVKGVQIFVKQDTTTFDSEGSMWYDTPGLVLSQYDLVDMYVTGVQEENASQTPRNLYAGFSATQLVKTSAIADGVFVSSKGAATPENNISSLANMHTRVAGTAAYTASDQHYGFGGGADGKKFLMAFGWRIYPPSTAYPNGRMFLLGEGRAELTELPIPSGWDWTKPLFPFFGSKSVGSGAFSSYTRVATFEVGTIVKGS